MSIWAEIKKAINSDLNKPLNITLDELKNQVDKAKKSTRIVTCVTGVIKNDVFDQQVLTLDDEPLISVKGSGRILQILPIVNYSNSERNGTGLLTVDDTLIFNNRVQYSYTASDRQGYAIVNPFLYTNTMLMYVDAITLKGGYYFMTSQILRVDASTFSTTRGGIIAPNGIPFKNGFELRLTQTMTTETDKVGAVIVYELDE